MKKELKKLIESKGLKTYGDLVMIDGELFPLPLVKGNSKIGANVWHASTLPTNKEIKIKVGDEYITYKGTCPMTCEGCYACKGNYKYNAIKYVLMMRTRLLREHMDIYFYLVWAQIQVESIKLLRVHASGDFVPNEPKGWKKIFESFPNLKGWTYTKFEIKDDIKELNEVKNFNIVDSIIKGCGFNFGHIDYILNVYEKLKNDGKQVYICRCGIDKNQHCETCGGCANNENVLFIEHSTEYKALKDPLFPTIKELIESQPKQEL